MKWIGNDPWTNGCLNKQVTPAFTRCGIPNHKFEGQKNRNYPNDRNYRNYLNYPNDHNYRNDLNEGNDPNYRTNRNNLNDLMKFHIVRYLLTNTISENEITHVIILRNVQKPRRTKKILICGEFHENFLFVAYFHRIVLEIVPIRRFVGIKQTAASFT